MPKAPEELRSHRWLGTAGLRSFGHRSRLLQIGYDREDFAGKPVVAIVNTWSDANPCHVHLRARADEVKRGVWQAGGFPLEMPAMSLSENLMKPTTMLYRNFLAMETEELIRSQPVDGAVLLGGCDKTLPALLMGTISAGVPAIVVPAGPMLRGNWRGEVLGSGTDSWKYWDEKRAGNITEDDWHEIEGGIARSFGTCMTMGTAATMMSIIEALGFTLPGASSIPAADSGHARMATASGRRIVEMIREDQTPERIVSEASLDNAIVAHAALGGSTNAIIHLVAIARRAGIPLMIDRFDEISRRVPVIANVRPSGSLLMEDFFYAGGMRAFLNRLAPYLDLSCPTVSGQTLGDNVAGARVYHDDVIRPLDNPVSPPGGTVVLRGNIAPDGAVMKASATEPHLLRHRGPVLAFESYDELAATVDREDLDVTPDHVLVLKNAGPQGGPGMPEWGMLPIPLKLVKHGVRDMVRISDARMSGTSYGACILHVAPEAFIGGPLAFVQTGDVIEVNVAERRLHLDVSDEELLRRREAWKPRQPRLARGYGAIFTHHVTQANEGCDFDILGPGPELAEPEIH
ncbi:MAG: dihydroxy-acid dehydratase [Candidatus Eremiobacteraeota bacterium]|nr:dihydroxy-acid dehydratase [Candidatus Eremiobacteraeota bacterium]